MTVIELSAGNVGTARAAGVAEVLRWNDGVRADTPWIAITDADSQVPSDLLTGQLELARRGWEVIVGTVWVADWSDHHLEVLDLWEQGYHAVEGHPHIHGANLGFTAQAYQDVALVTALSYRRVLRTATLAVQTNARRDPCAVHGFGATLNTIAS